MAWNKENTDEMIAKIKELVKEGNVSRILVQRNESTVLDIPVTAGVLGAAVGVAAAPWALIAGAVAALGLDCKVVLIKKDGSTVELLSRDVGKKAAGVGAALLEKLAGGKKD